MCLNGLHAMLPQAAHHLPARLDTHCHAMALQLLHPHMTPLAVEASDVVLIDVVKLYRVDREPCEGASPDHTTVTVSYNIGTMIDRR